MTSRRTRHAAPVVNLADRRARHATRRVLTDRYEFRDGALRQVWPRLAA